MPAALLLSSVPQKAGSVPWSRIPRLSSSVRRAAYWSRRAPVSGSISNPEGDGAAGMRGSPPAADGGRPLAPHPALGQHPDMSDRLFRMLVRAGPLTLTGPDGVERRYGSPSPHAAP